MAELGRVGHYRIVRQLGAGGMGEVYLGQDERLDRPVAIKRLHSSDDGLSRELRERFHREAHVAARLNHPAIVQVYDVVREGDTDCIVMEYVAGSNLREYLRSRRPSIGEILQIAQQVAEGMAEAHEQDIIHRDLKSENVLITEARRAKITDFGIAKIVGSDSLTADGTVLGTYRAMSPEQASGQRVDRRSDLFSFGVLLYEALTGETPFRAENPLAMVMRITHDQPEPIAQRVPGIPPQLVKLIEHLLRKVPYLRPRGFPEVAATLADIAGELDPNVRASTGSDAAIALEATEMPEKSIALETGATEVATPQGKLQALRDHVTVLLDDADCAAPGDEPAGESNESDAHDESEPGQSESFASKPGRNARWPVLAAALVATALAGVASYQIWLSGPAELRVAVLAPDIDDDSHSEEDKRDVRLAKRALKSAVQRGLTGLEGLIVVPLDKHGGDHSSEERRAGLARRFSVDELVTSSMSCTVKNQLCYVELSFWNADGVLRQQTRQIRLDLLELTPWALTIAGLARNGYPDRSARSGSTELKVSEKDYRRYLELDDSIQQADGYDEIIAGLGEIRRSSPGFLAAYILEVELLRQRFDESREPEDLFAARNVLQEAKQVAPNATILYRRSFEIAMALDDLAGARNALADIKRLEPGNQWILMFQSRLAYARGDLMKAIEIRAKAVKRLRSVATLYNLALYESWAGHYDDAREHMNQALEIWPDHFFVRLELAGFELINGVPQKALSLFRDLEKESSRDHRVYAGMGTAHLLLHQWDEAIADLERAADMVPKNPRIRFDLAYARMAKYEQVDALFGDIIQQVMRDPNPSSPEHLIIRAVAHAKLGQASQAERYIAEALNRARDVHYVAYYAAAAYALLGRKKLAREQANKAHERGGYSEPWFQLPWLEGIL